MEWKLTKRKTHSHLFSGASPSCRLSCSSGPRRGSGAPAGALVWGLTLTLRRGGRRQAEASLRQVGCGECGIRAAPSAGWLCALPQIQPTAPISSVPTFPLKFAGEDSLLRTWAWTKAGVKSMEFCIFILNRNICPVSFCRM